MVSATRSGGNGILVDIVDFGVEEFQEVITCICSERL